MTDFRYKAFVSYSWADAEWGKWLLQAIETYRTPAALVGKDGAGGLVPARLHPLFKDREEEAAGASIGQAVETALAGSEFLIVICSPRSARSQWVDREIAWFKTHRDPAKILALIVDGNPGGGDSECFPRALTHRVAADRTITDEPVDHPLAADARINGDGKRRAKLKLAAAMLGVGLDELVNRDERRRTIRTRIVVSASLALALMMSGLALAAVRARNEAVVQRGQAEGLVEFMIGDLRKNLQPKVQIEVLGSIADRAKAFYAVQGKYPMDEEALARRSRVLTLLGEIEVDRGNSDTSLTLFEQSVAASHELLARDPDNPDRVLEQAFALQRLGTIMFQHGDMGGAERQMQEAVNLTTHLIEDIGQKDEWFAEHGSALANLGIIQLQRHLLAPAFANLQKAVAIKQAALGKKPASREGWPDFGATLAWAAEAAAQNGDDSASQAYRQQEQKLYLTLLSENPDDLVTASALTASIVKQADALLQQQAYPAALNLARQAAARAEVSLSVDPGNTSVIEDTAKAAAVLAEAELMAMNTDRAAYAAKRSEALAMRLVAIDPAISSWNGAILGKARLLRIRAAARAASGTASCRGALGPVVAESARLEKLSNASPTVFKLGLVAARAVMMQGDHAALSGNLPVARAAWQRAIAIVQRPAGANAALKDRASLELIEQATARLTRATPQAMGCGHSS